MNQDDVEVALAAVHEVFGRAAAAEYLGESVTVAEHQLRTAARARRDGASAALIAAALLHDVGHLVPGGPRPPDQVRTNNTDLPASAGRPRPASAADAFDRGVDARHEETGAAWLARWFGPEVTEPVRLHVVAKRYLCAVDPGYLARLSPASRRTLAMQGGPLAGPELDAFRAGPHARSAERLRRWDDAGKDPLASVPPLAAYDPLLTALLHGSPGAAAR